MKITCPKCETSYNIGATSVGAEGRSVRCSRCAEEWYIDTDGHTIAAPPDDDANETADDAGADDVDWGAAFSEEADGVAASGEDDWKAEIGLAENEDAADDKPRALIDSEPAGFNGGELEGESDAATAALPGRDRSRNRSAYDARFVMSPEMRAMVGLALFLSSVVLSVGVILMREPIVRTAPNMAGLYRLVGLEVNLRGLEFHDLRTFQEYENGGVVLIVEGRIDNMRRRSTHVPAVQLSLRSSDAQEIYTWKIEPRVRRLPAGQNLRFSTRVASPPDIAADVHVRFVDRNNRQAKL